MEQDQRIASIEAKQASLEATINHIKDEQTEMKTDHREHREFTMQLHMDLKELIVQVKDLIAVFKPVAEDYHKRKYGFAWFKEMVGNAKYWAVLAFAGLAYIKFDLVLPMIMELLGKK